MHFLNKSGFALEIVVYDALTQPERVSNIRERRGCKPPLGKAFGGDF